MKTIDVENGGAGKALLKLANDSAPNDKNKLKIKVKDETEVPIYTYVAAGEEMCQRLKIWSEYMGSVARVNEISKFMEKFKDHDYFDEYMLM